METVLSYIDQKKNEIEKHGFFEGKSQLVNIESHLNFTPSMLFFIMGFADVLKEIKVENPNTALEHILNIHCEEDDSHWKWYLQDIQEIGFDLSEWGQSISDISQVIWSDELHPVREIIYNTISYIKNSKQSPETKFIIIEVMEATFGVFIKKVIKPLDSTGKYQNFKYFGELHVHAEENHSLGNWTDGLEVDEYVRGIKLDSNTINNSINMIDHLFDLFSNMFNSWSKYESQLHMKVDKTNTQSSSIQ